MLNFVDQEVKVLSKSKKNIDFDKISTFDYFVVTDCFANFGKPYIG